MAHYAFVENNVVTEVIVGIDENETIEGLNPELWYEIYKGKKCLRTSFNSNIRGNFASIGYSYLDDLDIFIPPKCHDEAILNLNLANWNCKNSDHEFNSYVEG
jgi:hypothetical protein